MLINSTELPKKSFHFLKKLRRKEENNRRKTIVFEGDHTNRWSHELLKIKYIKMKTIPDGSYYVGV